MNDHGFNLKLKSYNKKAKVRKRSLTVGLRFTCSTNLGFYFMTLDFFATVERG